MRVMPIESPDLYIWNVVEALSDDELARITSTIFSRNTSRAEPSHHDQTPPYDKGLRYPGNGAWPIAMRVDMAAAYVDERSISAFLKKVGTDYPLPIRGTGRRGVWSKASLDAIAEGGSSDGDELADLI